MVIPFSNEIEGYIRRSDEYWRQALGFLNRNELEKASELAWGSVAQRVKALALAKIGRELHTHYQIRDYVKRIASQTADENLFRDFTEAERLHTNFYEGLFDRDEVGMAFAVIRRLLARVDSYIRG